MQRLIDLIQKNINHDNINLIQETFNEDVAFIRKKLSHQKIADIRVLLAVKLHLVVEDDKQLAKAYLAKLREAYKANREVSTSKTDNSKPFELGKGMLEKKGMSSFKNKQQLKYVSAFSKYGL